VKSNIQVEKEWEAIFEVDIAVLLKMQGIHVF
jgi:hypothetical protein